MIILRIIAVFLTALLGIIGTLKELKDKQTGKLTRSGRVTILVISVAAVVTVVSDIYQTLEQRKETQKILSDLDRSLHRIEDVGIEFLALLPMDNPALAKYNERVSPILRSLFASRPSSESITWGSINVPFISKDPWLPDLETERVAYTFLSHVCIGLEIFSDSAKAGTFIPVAGHSSEAGDLVFLLSRSAGQTEKNDVSLGIDISKNRFSLLGWNAKTGPPEKSTGKIVAIPDLAGATAVIYFCPKGYRDDRERRDFLSVASALQLVNFGLNISGGRRMYLRLEGEMNQYGEQVYIFKFPKSVFNKIVLGQ